MLTVLQSKYVTYRKVRNLNKLTNAGKGALTTNQQCLAPYHRKRLREQVYYVDLYSTKEGDHLSREARDLHVKEVGLTEFHRYVRYISVFEPVPPAKYHGRSIV
jgi:hypothetical protein